ncbi:CpaF family protein [Noviherbaspirillum sp.]|uniref:CpaF family protein n=1 Tax=Noviherbaspirillum sp. TaxID=1926288 RepID=UPI002FE131D6
MSLRERLVTSHDTHGTCSINGVNAAEDLPRPAARTGGTTAYRELKQRTHVTLLERIDLKAMEMLPQHQRKDELTQLVEEVLSTGSVVVNDAERKTLVRDILHEMLGFGPLELLMADPTVSDILINTHRHVYVERNGKLEATDVCFNDNAHLMKIIDKIVSGVGRRVDEASPMVDARLPDGSRINVIIPPLAIDGPIMSIRRFSVKPLTMDDFLRFQTVTPPMAQFLEGAVRAKLNMMISGGTGGGKTTLLNILSGFIGAGERVVTIEDTAELRLQQPHVVRLESRPANIEGKGEISQRALVKNALRMRPDRIIVGEVRGIEAVDMMQAMNSGHEGSLATIHANSPRDALMRLENMISTAGLHLPPKTTRQQISSAIAIVAQIARMSDGRRRIVSIQEVTGMEGEVVTMQEIFTFRQTGVAADGTVQGQFRATGARPRCCDRLHAHGIDIPESLFDPTRLYDIHS